MSSQTDSERYLARLCRESFLSLWSFPSPYRDQAPAKEICDVLVVFPPHVIVFSDKDCQFRFGPPADVAWQRWFRAAVADSARQLMGAERWLKTHPNRIFVDRNCEQRLPVALPPANEMILHSVVVAHGAAEACKTFFRGTGSGSLMLHAEPESGEEDGLPVSGSRPFVVRHLTGSPRFVHVFDDTTTDLLIQNLDTVDDFVKYLARKERAFRSQNIQAAGEEELLAIYKTKMDAHGAHDFGFPEEMTSVSIAEGFWRSFQRDPQRVAQLEADKVSYLWDGLIEHFAQHESAGTLVYVTPKWKPDDTEKALRLLAREPRVRRRMLAKSVLEIAGKATPETVAARVLAPSNPGDPHYVFLIADSGSGDREKLREQRRLRLWGYCIVTRLVVPSATDVVGIAMDPPGSKPSSEDLIYFDARQWDDELEAEARRIQADFKIMTAPKFVFRGSESEYLSNRSTTTSRVGRNDPCPCGSGTKFKKCCGKRSN